IDSNAAINKAGTGLTVSVNATRELHAYAIGGSIGGIAAGAAVAVVNVDNESAPNWVSGTSYNAGDLVAFNGGTYKARNNIGNKTTDPATNTAEWAGNASATIGDVAVGNSGATPLGGITVSAIDSVNPDTYVVSVA